MAGFMTDEGKEYSFDDFFKRVGQTFEIREFVNDVTPDEDTELADLTENTATGYVSTTCDPDDWTISTALNITTAAYIQIEFESEGPVTCYGYYITDPGNTKCVYAERYDHPSAPFVVADGDTHIRRLTPTVKKSGSV